MPLYHYHCECGEEKETLRPMAERNKLPLCACGQEMERVLETPAPAIIPTTGRDKVLNTLNKEKGYNFPGGDKHRKRYEQAMAKGLDTSRPTIGRGF